MNYLILAIIVFLVYGIGIPLGNHPRTQADIMCTGCAGSDYRDIRSLHAVLN